MNKNNTSTRRNWKEIALVSLPKIKSGFKSSWFHEGEIEKYTPASIKKQVGAYFICYTVLNKLVRMGHAERRFDHDKKKAGERHYVFYKLVS